MRDDTFNKKLLVEGNNDQHVVLALCKKLDITKTFDIVDCIGIERLYKRLQVEVSMKKSDAIGIIIDADTDLQARYNSIKNRLSAFKLPDKLPEKGLIAENEEQKIGIWIMPNNNLNGMLEDFIAFLVPENDTLMSVAENTLQDIENKKLNKYSETKKSKAKIHTWLAWQEEPGKPLGQSITNKALSTDGDICQKFIEWLKLLFQ